VAKPAAAPVTPVVQQAAASRSRWTKKAQLSESKKAVRDVKFAPRHLGLMLASVSADGFVRIYEATDVFSLNIWQLQHTVQVEQMVDVLVVDIASSTSSSATGVSGTSSAATVPSSGPIFGGSLDVNTTQASSADIMGKSEQGLTCVSWNTCPFEPAKIAVGGYSSRAVVLSLEESKWSEECVLGEHSGVVHDIAWAPTMGRNYHQIATASREPTFRIHTLNRAANGSLEYRSSQTIESNSDVWRVAWNATGTVLATSSEDGTLALWRKDYNGEWKSVQTLAAGVINGNEETRAFYRI
jgi:nucleoporin SEH1